MYHIYINFPGMITASNLNQVEDNNDTRPHFLIIQSELRVRGYAMKTLEFLNKIGIFPFGAGGGTCSSANDAQDKLKTDSYKPKKEHSGNKEAEGQAA